MLAERPPIPVGVDRPTFKQLQERVVGGESAHAVTESVLEADSRIITTLSSLGRSAAEPKFAEMARLYDLPQGRVAKGFADGFRHTVGQFYSLVVTVSEQIEEVTLEKIPEAEEANMDVFERKRRKFAEEVSKNSHLREPDPQKLITTLQTNRSGVTWLDAVVQEEFEDNPIGLAGAQSAVRGAEKLYNNLKEFSPYLVIDETA